MKYRSGYKYQVAEREYFFLTVNPKICYVSDFIEIYDNGMVVVNPGYAYDGPSGPTIDTKNSMRGSLIHDVLYQLMRMGNLKPDYREAADDELYKALIEDKMWKIRAKSWRYFVGRYAASAADPKNRKKVHDTEK